MLVLALESATEMAGVALADDAGVIATATTSRGRHHAESITPSIEFVCERAGRSLRDVDGLCVDVGPGLFTGLRVGIATAKALGFALGIPVAAFGSLEVLAQALLDSGAQRRLLVPVVDAKRGEVFCARFRADNADETRAEVQDEAAHDDAVRETAGAQVRDAGSGPAVGRERAAVRVGEDLRCSPQDLVAALSVLEEPFVLAGDGALRYAEVFGTLGAATIASDELANPPVGVLARLGLECLRAGGGTDAAEISPRYLREADTRINWEQRLPQREPSRTGT